MGSITVTTDPDRLESSIHNLVYSSSKAALNMVMTQYAKAFPDITVNAADPGYTATDLNANTGHNTVEQEGPASSCNSPPQMPVAPAVAFST
jgi:NAD(P)-dependent dehydrogenase (short-subunit alcohol dehydrogenase family)